MYVRVHVRTYFERKHETLSLILRCIFSLKFILRPMRRTREADQASKLFKKTEKCHKTTTGRNLCAPGARAGCFVSRQVRSLDTGRDKKETHLISLKQAHGAFFCDLGREDGRETTRNEAFCAQIVSTCMHIYVCMYQICISIYIYIFMYVRVHVRTYF